MTLIISNPISTILKDLNELCFMRNCNAMQYRTWYNFKKDLFISFSHVIMHIIECQINPIKAFTKLLCICNVMAIWGTLPKRFN